MWLVQLAVIAALRVSPFRLVARSTTLLKFGNAGRAAFGGRNATIATGSLSMMIAALRAQPTPGQRK
jgi:hypothetical protein